MPKKSNFEKKDWKEKEKEKFDEEEIIHSSIFHTITILEVLNDNPIIFFKKLNHIIKELYIETILLKMPNTYGSNANSEFYYINQKAQYDYFSITVNIEQKTLKLFFCSKSLYLQGFTFETTYYYFEDSTLINPNIKNIIYQSLYFVGSYVASNGLQAHNNYSWQTIHNDFLLLTNSNLNENQIKCSLIGVILATSESIRFRSVKYFILQSQRSINPIIQSWVFFQKIIRNWDRGTHNAINYLLNNKGNLNKYFHQELSNNGLRIMVFNTSMYHAINNYQNPPLITPKQKWKIKKLQDWIDTGIKICEKQKYAIAKETNKFQNLNNLIEILKNFKNDIITNKKLQDEIKTAKDFADNIIEINKVFDIKTNPENIKSCYI
ncbi:ribosome-inactivating family protein [Spiroplasma endosymbiont of Danaus chrysippus]|uniref:ribosome-inactivating family protein n=1 Tax=Spiroplasma endosymbiont of Danaus chrysippus TaxID=2691041 RepID=UPI00157B30FD|nr:ribosome-inactivating family protein [Spiroplasma endosymbiont of Danaus chrysippus]